ncbi:ABC transporter substrate-binding protein [Gordonia sp. PP30]|uniref:ABC transporter substrate-binding protein n=2 Tax=Gordonia TaxID=2053 RepID=UPI001FFFC19D|nr:ABC transporter substrate-binding protein [Gordonia sp. PP30]UQE74164.1 ABC transporter substrate-binding protein [Gordonia sp. PP30]
MKSNLSERWKRAAVAGVAAALALGLTACGSGDDSAGSGKSMTVVLPWYADPEGGGYFAAQEKGMYTGKGLHVTLQPGGPQVSATQLVSSGRAQIGHTDAAGVVAAQQQGIPIVAIAAMYQDNPVGVLSHKDQNITSFEQMKGRSLVSQAGALYPVWLDKELGVPLKTVQYQGSIASFLHDPSLLQQGWPTNEVRQAEEQGVPVNFIPYSKSGFNPYNDVLFTSKDYFDSHKKELKDFLEASIQGWHDYLADIDTATAANNAILKANSEQSKESVWFAWDAQRKFIVAGDGARQLGAMTEARWSLLLDQLRKLDQIKHEVKPSDVYDASLLPQIAAPTDLPPIPAG